MMVRIKKGAIRRLLLRFQVRGPLRLELDAQRREIERIATGLRALQRDLDAEAAERDKISSALFERIERLRPHD